MHWQSLTALFWPLLLALIAQPVLADIRSTPHALVKSKLKDGSDICVFCHTPNVTAGTPPVKAPLWQHAIGTELVFTIYDDIGRLGLGKTSVGSQSIACLSCHDSIQAASISKTSDNHPFGVPYRGATKGRPEGFIAVRPAGMSGKVPVAFASNLVALDDFRDVSQGIVEERTVWWVSPNGITGRRTRGDLPLYTRHDGGSGQDIPHIECSSCHDPHSDNQMFLRVANGASRLCLTCHIK